jgi:hypothetical protein
VHHGRIAADHGQQQLGCPNNLDFDAFACIVVAFDDSPCIGLVVIVVVDEGVRGVVHCLNRLFCCSCWDNANVADFVVDDYISNVNSLKHCNIFIIIIYIIILRDDHFDVVVVAAVVHHNTNHSHHCH